MLWRPAEGSPPSDRLAAPWAMAFERSGELKSAGGGTQTVFIGIGETEDPFPGERKPTDYWVFAGCCPGCGSATRFLLPGTDVFYVVCRICSRRQDVGLAAGLVSRVTYVHWCREARFPSDEVALSPDALAGMEECIKNLGGEIEPPAWGVKIIGMKCEHASRCIAPGCPYRPGPGVESAKVVDLARRRMKRKR